MKNPTSLLLLAACAVSGCATVGPDQPLADAIESTVPEVVVQRPAQTGGANLPSPTPNGDGSDKDFANSEFIANDFLSVIQRVPEFIAGQTSFSATLPRTRYGEILMEQLRQSGYTIVLGQSPELPALSYRVELPSGIEQNLHTFYVSVGKVHFKRSYEVVDNRIAPVTEMLMAGVDTNRLRPLTPSRQTGALSAARAPEPSQEVVVASATKPPPARLVPSPFAPDPALAPSTGNSADVNAADLNRLLIADEDWNPLDSNLYLTVTSVYDPLFSDASNGYDEISSDVLIFPNDSLVLGKDNKNYLVVLAGKLQSDTDVIRVIGCSHGKTDVVEGNQKLARGRAIRVKDELVLAGVDDSAVLHEACWAPRHFDEVMPRRGVVVMHLREQSQ